MGLVMKKKSSNGVNIHNFDTCFECQNVEKNKMKSLNMCICADVSVVMSLWRIILLYVTVCTVHNTIGKMNNERLQTVLRRLKVHVVELQSLTTTCCNLLVVKLHSYFVLHQVFQLLFGSFFVV